MVVFSLLIINKAGGLVYNRDFHSGLNKLSSNDLLVLAGTFHGWVELVSFSVWHCQSSPINSQSWRKGGGRERRKPLGSTLSKPCSRMLSFKHLQCSRNNPYSLPCNTSQIFLLLVYYRTINPSSPLYWSWSPWNNAFPPSMFPNSHWHKVLTTYRTPTTQCGRARPAHLWALRWLRDEEPVLYDRNANSMRKVWSRTRWVGQDKRLECGY